MWGKIFQPLSVAVMMLMALSFIGVRLVFHSPLRLCEPVICFGSFRSDSSTCDSSHSQESGRYLLNMWGKIFQPLSVAVMMLMALSFIFGITTAALATGTN
jgi:lipopolysaccharide export LptBFGC system permease protein LptF